MQNHFDGVVPSLIYPLKTECRDPVGWTTINEDGGVADEKETHHASLFPLQRLEETKKRKTVENAFLVDQCTKVVDFLFVLFVGFL